MKPETLARIARVLRAANSRPFNRDMFYPIKTAILHAYATEEPFDVQRIAKDCWGCSGTGMEHGYDDLNECRRCEGSGVYDVVYVKLKRWNLAGSIFHEPVERLAKDEADYYVRLEKAYQIEGLIKHRRCQRSYIACAAIGRMFDSGYYWKTLEFTEASRFQNTCRRTEQIARWITECEYEHPVVANFRRHHIPIFSVS
jgi:hypothetical protein